MHIRRRASPHINEYVYSSSIHCISHSSSACAVIWFSGPRHCIHAVSARNRSILCGFARNKYWILQLSERQWGKNKRRERKWNKTTCRNKNAYGICVWMSKQNKKLNFLSQISWKKHTLVRAHLKCINNDARMRELKEDSRRSFKTQRSSSHITSLTCTTKNVRLLEHSHRAACNVWQMEEQISLQHSAYFLLSGQMQLLNSWMHRKFKVLMQRKRSIKHISPAAIMIFAWITGISEL